MSTANQPSTDRSYHEHNRNIPLADRLGYIARMRMYQLFIDIMMPGQDSTILDIGVTDDIGPTAANLLEQLYPYKSHITCAGITQGKGVEQAYLGVRHVQITPGEPLPFADDQFDIVYSNAVLEHVGSRKSQAEFIAEACRVGRSVFIAVPNRLFPIEVHTGIPFLHWLPVWLFRDLIRSSRFAFFSHEQNLNYLSPDELRSIYPKGRQANIVFAGIGLGPFKSNLVSYTSMRVESRLSRKS